MPDIFDEITSIPTSSVPEGRLSQKRDIFDEITQNPLSAAWKIATQPLSKTFGQETQVERAQRLGLTGAQPFVKAYESGGGPVRQAMAFEKSYTEGLGADIVDMIQTPILYAPIPGAKYLGKAASNIPIGSTTLGRLVKNVNFGKGFTKDVKELMALDAKLKQMTPLSSRGFDTNKIKSTIAKFGGKFNAIQLPPESMYEGEAAIWYESPSGSTSVVPISKFSETLIRDKIIETENKMLVGDQKKFLSSAKRKMEALPSYQDLYKKYMTEGNLERAKLVEERMKKVALTPEEEKAFVNEITGQVPTYKIPELEKPGIPGISGKKGGVEVNVPDISFVKKFGDLIKYYLGRKEERWKVGFGEKKGQRIFEQLRFLDRSINSMKAEIERRNKAIFIGLPKRIREHIFDVVKGIKRLDENGNPEFGASQPSGIIEGTFSPGQVLDDGKIVGEAIDDNKFQTYRRFNTQQEYDNLIAKYPAAKKVIEKYLANEEEIKRTILGTDMPAFARDVFKKQFNIVTNQPDDFSYVPSMLKEQRFIGKLKNIFKSFTASGRLKKTGALAEEGLEERDILKAWTIRQQQFAYENLHNDTAGNILAMVLEPIEGQKIKPGYVQFNINHPRISKITELKKDLFIANGIDPEKSLYQYPRVIEDEFKLQTGQKFANPVLQDAFTKFQRIGNLFVGGVTTNYLIKPSTANRNFVSGVIQYSLKVQTHFYEGMLGKSGGFSRAIEDIKSLGTALLPSSRKAIPSEVLGETFVSDIAGKKSVFSKFLAPFRAIEYYFKRASFVSDLNFAANNKFRELLKTGEVQRGEFNKFTENFKKNFFLDMFQEMSDSAASVTFDYWDKPYFLEKIPKGMVPFPNYFYHKIRMYAEYSPAGLVGINKTNAKTKVAKVMAGLTTSMMAFEISEQATEQRRMQKKDLSLKRMDYKFDTTGRIEIFADDEVERWLRVYDWPILGDILYWREILDGNADFGDWLRESVSLGPFFNVPVALLGLKSKYELQKDTAGILGQQIAGWIPFGAYLNYTRILSDPQKREVYSEDYSAFENFMNPIINIIPGLSEDLPADVAKIGMEKGKIREYDIDSETMKMFFLNVKSIDKKEYFQYLRDQDISGKLRRRIKKQARMERK